MVRGRCESLKRDSNIELLRIFAASGVIILHYNNWNIGGGLAFVQPASVNAFILCAFQCLCIGAVDLFMLISGYFSEGKKRYILSKTLTLLFEIIVIRGIKITINIFVYHETYDLGRVLLGLIPKDYFIWTYIAVNLLSPYINKFADSLRQSERKKLLVLLFSMFSIWPTMLSIISLGTGISLNDLSIVTSSGTDSGYSVVNYFLMFYIGLYIKKEDLNIKHSGIAIIPIYALNLFWFTAALNDNIGYGIPLAYCNPLVIAEVVLIFMCFRKKHVHSRIINWISSASFTVYLTHNYFIQLFHIKEYVLKNCWIMLLHICFTSLALYALGIIIHIVLLPVVKLWKKAFLRVNIAIEVE